MGLFSRKPSSTAGADGRVIVDIPSSGTDGYYETACARESKHRTELIAALRKRKRAKGWQDGRVPVEVLVVPLLDLDYASIAVEIDGQRVAYMPDDWTRDPRHGGILFTGAQAVSGEVAFRAQGAICWKAERGNPLDDESIPIGVRLDIEDEGAIRRGMGST